MVVKHSIKSNESKIQISKCLWGLEAYIIYFKCLWVLLTHVYRFRATGGYICGCGRPSNLVLICLTDQYMLWSYELHIFIISNSVIWKKLVLFVDHISKSILDPHHMSHLQINFWSNYNDCKTTYSGAEDVMGWEMEVTLWQNIMIQFLCYVCY